MLEGFKEINSHVQHSEKQANNQTKNPQNSGGKSFKTTPSGDSNTAQKSKENPHYIEIHIKQRRTKVLNSWAIADSVQGTLYHKTQPGCRWEIPAPTTVLQEPGALQAAPRPPPHPGARSCRGKLLVGPCSSAVTAAMRQISKLTATVSTKGKPKPDD